MSFSDSRPGFMQPLPPFSGNGDGPDGGGFWPQHPSNSEQFDPQLLQYPPFKRQRNSVDNQSNSLPRMNTQHPPVNKGNSNIFFKTRMCAKFKMGMCRNGENCNFAHGSDDLRQPPPNWQELVSGREEEGSTGNWEEDQKIIHKMKLCKKFYNGEECPYGERCNFLHQDPAMFREDSGRFRERSVISIGTIGSPPASGSNNLDANKVVNSGGSDVSRVNLKPVYWKTRLCTKWETTGHCPFYEKCHFAHGKAELQAPGGRIETEASYTGPGLTKPNLVAPTDAPPSIGSIPASDEGQKKKCLLKMNRDKKINHIYGDWLDDLPLLPSKLEG